MKINYSLLLVFLGLLSCEKTKESSSVIPAKIDATANYEAPFFEDSNRLEKIKIVLPVLDKIFKDRQANDHFPGVAFGLIVDGRLIHTGSFGIADITSKTAVTPNTNFRIASMSKSFTAMAVLKLRDEGKLSLSDPASKYIPEFARLEYLTSDSPPITIEHLLTMSAGFPEDNPWGDRQLSDTDEDLIKQFKEGISFSNSPGLVFEYSNLGFATLGNIVTKVSGKPYQQYINENILRPLHMNDARWEYSEIPKEQFAPGYRWEDDQWKEEPILHDGSYGAMGGLICSIEDFSKYVAFHLSAWPPRNEEESSVIKRSSLREMHQLQRLGGLFPNNKNRDGSLCPVISGYGYGLGYRHDCRGIVSIRHGGGLPGYGSEWRFYPEYGIGIVSLSNLTYGGLGGQNGKALDTLIHLAGLKRRIIPVSSILKQRQQEIVAVISSWPEDQLNIFAENFFLDKSLDAWRKFSAEQLAQIGKIITIKSIIPENQLRGTFVVEGEKNNLEIFFTLTPEHDPLIQQLEMEVITKSFEK
jgi:CubicO group peptidase (beta-lactamase class C family)